MTMHTSSNIIFDDTWNSIYACFDKNERLWWVRIRIDKKYFIGKGLNLQAAVHQCRDKITRDEFQTDLATYARDTREKKPTPTHPPMSDEKIEDIF